MPDEYVDYGTCQGIAGERGEHFYLDGKKHLKGSHGLCSECYDRMMELVRIAEDMRAEEELQIRQE